VPTTSASPPTREEGRTSLVVPGARALLLPLAVGAATAVAALYVAAVDPNRPGHYLVCPVYLLTGMYCAGCGGLRATHDLLHGDLAGAWAMNPLWVLIAPVLVVAWLRWVARVARPGAGGRRPARAAPGWLPWAFLTTLIGYSVVRNLPALAPWLAP